MAITQKAIPHIFRNKYLKNSSAGGTTYIGGTSSVGSHIHENKDVLDTITGIDVESWKNKLDKTIWDKAFIIDENNNLRVKLNLIGEQEVSAYGAGSTGGSGGVVTIVDNLTSTATDCALSANQGRVLKTLIEDKTGVSSWNDLTDKPSTFTPSAHSHTVADITNLSNLLDGKAATSHVHTIANITELQTKLDAKADNTTLTAHTSNSTIHITAAERTNWNVAFTNNHTHSNKSVLDGITSTKVSNWDGVVTNWNKAFEFDADNNLRVKLNLIGEGEVSAYGSGSTSSGGAFTIVDNLTSTSTDAALSANQGRVLKGLIDSKSSISSWNDLTDKPSTFTPATHTHIVTDITNLSNLLDGKAAASHTHNYTSTVKVGTTAYNVVSNMISLPAYPTSLPASDVYAWAKASTKPSYNYSEVGAAASNHTHTDLNRIWNSTITIGSWSRLCYAININLGGSFLLSINYTRNSVVVNYTFLIAFGHNYNASITTLSPYGYTQIQLRLTMSDANNVYIELLDANSGSGTQAVRCAASKIDCILTTYTTYTAGSGTVGASTQTEIGRLKLNNNTLAFLTDNVASSTKLVTPRTINGTNFDGTANITTANWGTARTLSLAGNASGSVSINGGSNVTLSVSNNYASSAGNAQTVGGRSVDSLVNFDSMAYVGDYEHAVIALVRLDYIGAWSAGRVWTARSNILYNCAYIDYSIGAMYKGSGGAPYNIGGTIISYGSNYEVVAFKYNNVWYGGLKLARGAAQEQIYVSSSTRNIAPFVVSYYITNTSSILNSEIYNSITTSYNNFNTNIYGIASSATKLQDSRTIFGKSFNGTNNVNGGAKFVNICIETNNSVDDTNRGSEINNYNSILYMQHNTSNHCVICTGGGNVGISTTTPSYKLHVNGTIYSSSNIVAAGEITAYSSSDKRLKKDIKSINSSLSLIEKLNPVQFRWNKKAKELNQIKDDRLNYGLIAQEVEKVIPELVHPIYDKYKSVDYQQLIPFLIQSIKELKSEIDTLKNNNNTKQII